MELRAKLMEVVVIVGLELVPRAGVEPARPYGQRILTPVKAVLLNLTKRYEPIFTGLAVVKGTLRLASYQPVAPHLSPIFGPLSEFGAKRVCAHNIAPKLGRR